ncbi:MAG: Re/Si-specific NAD(P)(+) transhydrogenase subunit alpha [Sandaracinaceae bacterium]|nr:Re/Si-specific NAD(P)(+) transhydrogenase subunit alpha [Sandaracinaceae bacterium]
MDHHFVYSPAHSRRCAIRLGVVRESQERERRVGIAPPSLKRLIEKLGFEVIVERGAGEAAGFSDASYEEAGATLVDPATVGSYREAETAEAWTADVLVKVNPPTLEEAKRMRSGTTLVSLVFPAMAEELLADLAKRGVTVLALDMVPRISRAQSMDVLSSMANIAGYRAVLEAAQCYQGFFTSQTTAAGSLPPARVLVIGAGVAGLAAIAAARALGAEVRAFDTRPATREQIESLGGTFLELDFEESGEGGGGYAKVMSKEFIEAEMKLFREQAKEVDVIITTALIPGKKAPVLVPKDVVDELKPGSVVVDLAAAQGGNCELSEPDVVVEYQGVKIIGYTDLTSRMATSASRFFSANVTTLLKECGGAEEWNLDMENEVLRGACVVLDGEPLPPPERKPMPEAQPQRPSMRPAADAKPAQDKIMSPTRRAWGTTLGSFVLVLTLFVLGRFAPSEFLQHLTVFVLACFVGWQVIWSVSPALHTPLMSVTNAISGIIIVGGMLQVGGGALESGELDLASILGAVAIFVAAINISGGFLVTQRMLRMFHREDGR